MSRQIKINYNDTFGTAHSRNYYRGQSFHYAGEWAPNVHYVCDDYVIDFVSINNTVLACAKSHLSDSTNKPTEFVMGQYDSIVGVVSTYWDFVLSGRNGKDGKVYQPVYDNTTGILTWELVNIDNLPEVIDFDLNLIDNINAAIREAQAATSQLIDIEGDVNDAISDARQAVQDANSAAATAQGVAALLQTLFDEGFAQETGNSTLIPMSQKATTDALNNKVDKVSGKGLSTNDYTNADKQKLNNIPNGAEENVIETISVNGTQVENNNKNINIVVPTDLSDLSDDETHRVVTDEEKQAWNAKQNTISDLGAIRLGANAGSTAYQKPQAGIPDTDLTEGVQTSLGKADTALQPNDNITSLTNNAGYITQSDVLANQSFPQNWTTDDDMEQLIDDINADDTAVVGKSYISNVTLSDLPDSAVQAELKVEILDEIDNLGKLILFTTTGSSQTPYHWEYISTYGTLGQWKSFVTSSQLSTVATSGDYNDLLNKPSPSGSFKGTSETGLTEQQFLTWAETLTASVNDYCYWQTTADNAVLFKRYRYTTNGWAFEYYINNTNFTDAQWNAMNSGITADIVNNIYQKPVTGIPKTDLAQSVQNILDQIVVISQEDYNDLNEPDATKIYMIYEETEND